MEVLIKARLLADYIATRWTYSNVSQEIAHPISDNIGVILADAVLQSGLNYRTIVLPRLKAISAAFPKLHTISELRRLLVTTKFREALNWNHPEKPRRLRHIVEILYNKNIESINDLVSWLSSQENRNCLLDIKGVGLKTIDYLGRLLGLQFIAVDRHAFRLLKSVGILSHTYQEARRILEFAADLLKISRWGFDKLMWQNMSLAL